jgi:hypothetical protein
MAGISRLCVRLLERHYAGLGHREHRLGDPLHAARVRIADHVDEHARDDLP